MNRKKIFTCLALSAMLCTSFTAGAQLDKILKGGGIAFLITKFGPDINKFVNRLTKTDTEDKEFDTKVVPILSGGTGTYAGAVQVAGPRDSVKEVVAVAQVEGKFAPLGMRVRALIPISDKDVKDVSKLKRVNGVGVSGLLDVKL